MLIGRDRSGQSIFTRPRPIDLTAARRAGYSSLDLDLDEEEEDGGVVFDATEEEDHRDIPHVAQTARDRA